MTKFIRGLLFISLLAAFLSSGHVSPAAADGTVAFDQRDHPVYVIASYYDAINRGDFARAYNYWRDQPPNSNTFQQWVQGFANVQDVRVLARLPVAYDGTAGTAHALVPVIVLATLKTGGQEIYAGCFHATNTTAPIGNPPVIDPNWYLKDANLQPALTVDFAQATDACLRVESFPTGRGYYNHQSAAIDLVSDYYDAIANGDYAQAYSFWRGGPPGQTLVQFTQGFAGTSNIEVWVPLTFETNAAAGTVYFEMKILLTALSYGTPQFFSGCLTASQTGLAANPVDPNWYIYRASLTATPTLDNALVSVWDECAW